MLQIFFKVIHNFFSNNLEITYFIAISVRKICQKTEKDLKFLLLGVFLINGLIGFRLPIQSAIQLEF